VDMDVDTDIDTDLDTGFFCFSLFQLVLNWFDYIETKLVLEDILHRAP
jgi:hypothetical protein